MIVLARQNYENDEYYLNKYGRVVLFNMQGMRNQYSKSGVVRNQRKHIRNTFILASKYQQCCTTSGVELSAQLEEKENRMVMRRVLFLPGRSNSVYWARN